MVVGLRLHIAVFVSVIPPPSPHFWILAAASMKSKTKKKNAERERERKRVVCLSAGTTHTRPAAAGRTPSPSCVSREESFSTWGGWRNAVTTNTTACTAVLAFAVPLPSVLIGLRMHTVVLSQEVAVMVHLSTFGTRLSLPPPLLIRLSCSLCLTARTIGCVRVKRSATHHTGGGGGAIFMQVV